jgi:signal transduction histidine kinase
MDTLGLGSAALFAVAPVLGVALGQLYRLHRLNQANIASSQQSLEALEQLARDATEARHAIVAMMGRQRVWTTLMEEQLAEHTRTREKAVETVRKLEEKKVAVVRTYSHDLRSPLTVIRCAVAMLENYGSFGLRRDQAELYKDLAIAVNKMEHILHELMAAVSRETGANRRVPERIDVHAFADQVRRQLRAFAYGRDIRVSAFCTREAPESIETDRLLFDRIMDNLVTNAVKYTEKGSIVVEIDGVPGYLTFKISDTGRGISDDEIDHIFEPGGSSASTRAAESYGIGLSVVVKLLDDIGGLLEVQSKPHVGTTFWVYFPVKVRTTPIPRKTGEDEDESGPITRVVTIRRQADHS